MIPRTLSISTVAAALVGINPVRGAVLPYAGREEGRFVALADYLFCDCGSGDDCQYRQRLCNVLVPTTQNPPVCMIKDDAAITRAADMSQRWIVLEHVKDGTDGHRLV